MTIRRASLAPAVLLVCASSMAGQQLRNGPGGEPPLDLPRIEGPIVIDGRVEEAAWAGAALLEGIVQLPDLGLSPAKEGNDLYIVWNETFNSDRFSLDPVASFSQERTLLVKYSHTLTLGL